LNLYDLTIDVVNYNNTVNRLQAMLDANMPGAKWHVYKAHEAIDRVGSERWNTEYLIECRFQALQFNIAIDTLKLMQFYVNEHDVLHFVEVNLRSHLMKYIRGENG